MSIGDALARARSQAGLTIAEVSQRTRIRETIVRGIEHDDFSACGGDFYARGHIRSIARVVGVDPEPLIHEYDTTHGAPQAIRAADVFEPATPIKLKERRRGPNWSVAMIIVLALLVGYGVYRAVAAVAAPGGHSPVAAPPSHHPSTAAAAPSTPAPTPTHVSHKVVIRLTAIEDCWVEFTTPAGGYLSQDYVVGGSSMTWTFHRNVTMQIGNPGGILLTVNGTNLGRPGAVGQPVTLSFGPGKKLPPQASG